MGDQEDIMLTFRQKIQLNNNEHMFFRQEVESWRDDFQIQPDVNTLEDISYIESSEDEENSDPGDELLKKGNMCMEKGEWARAISMYTSAISKKRKAKYYTARAVAYLKRCSFIEAEKDCTEAINLEPQFTKAYIRRALARKLLGKCKDSCDDMEMIMKLDPENSIVSTEYEAMLDYLQKNLLPSAEGNSGEQEKVETAMKLKQLGNELVSKCEYKRAIVKFTGAIKLNPKDPTFYANRAICSMKLKDLVSAEKDCSKALELEWKYAKVYLRRARVRKCLGKLYESRQDFYSAYELTEDEKVVEEMEEVERSISRMETLRKKKGEEVENHCIFSILEKDGAGHPKKVQLSSLKLKSRPLVNVKDSKVAKNELTVHASPLMNENDPANEQTHENGSMGGIKNLNNNTRKCMQQTNTEISIPATKSASKEEYSSKYDIREVFPLNRDDPSVKFTGPFIRVMIKDGKFAVPDKLLEIPDELMRNLLPR